MKIIAFYLPQFHNIPENDEWWGDGFTEWVNVKSAEPLFEGHYQPVIPLMNNYYNLLDDDVKIWQARIAKEHGIFGFCYYHYWFNGKMLLEKPMEQMLKNKKVDIPFCICWANEPWTKAWIAQDQKVLIPQKYGGEKEWKEHFDYLLQFLRDDRYILKDEKPIIIIYRPKSIPCLKEMVDYWRFLAIQNGLKGLSVMCAINNTEIDNSAYDVFDNIIEWEPHTAKWDKSNTNKDEKGRFSGLKKFRKTVWNEFEKVTGIDPYKYDPIALKRQEQKRFLNYDDIWQKIIQMKPIRYNSLPGAFVRWDNTPRYKEKASIILGETPDKFREYLKKQIIHAKEEYKTNYLFMYAWNEWAEGGYLEPDEKYGFAYLEALEKALKETGEFPNDKR